MAQEGWERLQSRLASPDLQRGRLLVGLDLDGTLAEIAERPESAFISETTRELVRLLSRRPDTRVVILSGRALPDAVRMLCLPGIYYAGNHGLEIRGPGFAWTHPDAGSVAPSIWRGLEQDLDSIPGAFLERKRLGAAVHYRGVPRPYHRRLRRLVLARARDLQDRFRLLAGKKTYDLRPRIAWDKGRALEMIRRRIEGPQAWLAVLVGDDATDEEGFRTLGRKALTVRVGRVRASAAEFAVPRRALVDHLLKALAERGARPSPD